MCGWKLFGDGGLPNLNIGMSGFPSPPQPTTAHQGPGLEPLPWSELAIQAAQTWVLWKGASNRCSQRERGTFPASSTLNLNRPLQPNQAAAATPSATHINTDSENRSECVLPYTLGPGPGQTLAQHRYRHRLEPQPTVVSATGGCIAHRHIGALPPPTGPLIKRFSSFRLQPPGLSRAGTG